MKNKKESGITLLSLIITIIVITIIGGISLNASTDSIKASKYTIFETELKLMQVKINQISEQYTKQNTQIGESLNVTNKQTLSQPEVTEILNKRAENNQGKLKQIKEGFRLCTAQYITDTLQIEHITRDYLVNIEECLIVSAEPLKYNETNYYMLEQMGDGLYNVAYNNQISNTGTFEVTATKKEDKYEITITPKHEKYVSKWQIQYRLQQKDYWETTENTTFTVDEPGIYEIKVTHGQEIDLGSKTIEIEDPNQASENNQQTEQEGQEQQIQNTENQPQEQEQQQGEQQEEQQENQPETNETT